MPSIIPYLSGGRTLDGVRAPSEALDSDDSLADIESCIDDPTLAPLGKHVTFRKKDRKHTDGQVEIKRSDASKEVSSDGLLMLRRRGMESDELARQLQDMMSNVSISTSPFRDLVELDISRNRLASLPSDIAMLQHLKILNASSNLLASIPDVLYRLPQLQVLILNQNQLESIPSEMPIHLPNLRTLRMAGNRIRHIDADLSLWVRMRQLQLGSVFGGNLLTAIPDQVADMPMLEELDLSHNQLRYLPSNMHIATLIHLNVSDNQLGTLPPSISQCRQLRTLNVSKNHLATLPADLVQLSKLELFDVSENLLCIMPADILERMRSTTLLITGNPLTQPGHCDLSTSDPYTRVLQQMTQRAVPMTPTVLSRDQCGPYGSGCEGPSTIGSPRRQRRRILADEDHDATIDHELSFRARQLNVRGSSPSSPQLILSPPPERQVELRAPEEPQVQQQQQQQQQQRQQLLEYDRDTQQAEEADDEQEEEQEGEEDITEEQDSTANSYGLVHSLRELSLRTILRERLEVPLNRLPDHVAKDIDRKYRLCAACQQPFVNEWVTSVQVKSYKGHPAVVRRVRFCTTACWQTCLNKSKEVQSRSIPAVMPPPRVVPGTIDWIELAVAAAAEQENQYASHFVIPSSSSTPSTV